MEGLNEVNLIGSVAKEVELKHFENDKKVARILLATSKSYKKQNGEKEEKTEWHNIDFWGETAQFCANYIKKGMVLYIKGELKTDSYEKDGVMQYRTKIIGEKVKIVSNGTYSSNDKVSKSSTDQAPKNEKNNSTEEAREQSKQYANDSDDDLPF